MAMRLLSLLGSVFVSSSAFAAAELTSEATFVFVHPETSSFWHTAPGSSVTVPLEWPAGAASATLVVKGLDYEKAYDGLTGDSFTFALPEATSAATENVYDLTLAFDDAAKTTRTAKLGLVQGLSSDPEGATRCRTPKTAKSWGKEKSGRAVLPIPYGTTSFTIDGVETATGLDGDQGWFALGGIGSNGRLALALAADGVESTATLFGCCGLLMIVR